jgi:ABC-type Mn2+/Zn2+ transport system permease subunit
MWFLLGIILWIILAFWPAIIARRKGHSFILFFLLSIVFFFLSLVLALLVKDRTVTSADIAADKAAEKAIEKDESKV